MVTLKNCLKWIFSRENSELSLEELAGIPTNFPTLYTKMKVICWVFERDSWAPESFCMSANILRVSSHKSSGQRLKTIEKHDFFLNFFLLRVIFAKNFLVWNFRKNVIFDLNKKLSRKLKSFYLEVHRLKFAVNYIVFRCR